MSETSQGLWGETLRRVRKVWPGSRRGALKDQVSKDLSGQDAEALRAQIDACLEAHGGEVSARARAAELGETYLVLSPDGRRRFLEILANDYDAHESGIERGIDEWRAATGTSERARALARLRELLRPPRVKLLSQFNTLVEGVKFLVDLRAELIPLARHDPALKALDGDVHRLLASWFDVGFLDLKRITWDSPASLLERLTAYEAVHEIRSWQDLKNRLGEDRRCFAYFHPHMPEEPLIFVEVALVNGIASNVQDLLDPKAPILDAERTDTAIFYSISNCQAGLAGVSFGNFLIKRVVDQLRRELPNLKTFCTLSPIPRFRQWLDGELTADRVSLEEKDRDAFMSAVQGENLHQALGQLLDRRNSYSDEATAAALQRVLMHECARYLLEAKHRGRTMDRVAHFHLSNGAMVERLNWQGDTSRNGLRQSAGLMVNYLYKLQDIERNHEAYSDTGQVTASSTVRRLSRS